MRKEDFVDYHLTIRGAAEDERQEQVHTTYFTEEDDKALSQAWDDDDRLTVFPKELYPDEFTQDDQTSDDLQEQEDELFDEDRKKEKNVVPSRTWRFPSDLMALELDFVENYKSYMMTADPEIEQWLEGEMTRQLSELCTYKIYLRIWDHEAYTWREEERIANEGNERALMAMREQKHSGRILPDAKAILIYFRTIYKNKTRDFFRRAAREAKLFEQMPTDGDGNDISDHNKFFGTPFEDPFRQGRRSPKDIALMRKILRMYFRELMDYSGEPSKALAVMYARVLYQMEPHGDPDGIVRATEAMMRKKGWSTDPDSLNYEFHWYKAQDEVRKQPAGASPAWALSRMEDMDLELLEDDSEASMQRNFDESLAWGMSMRGKLTEVSAKFAPARWGELVYTKCFTKADIQAWADSVHESTMKKTARKMSLDEACCQGAEELLSKSHPLMDALSEYRQKTRKKHRKEADR